MQFNNGNTNIFAPMQIQTGQPVAAAPSSFAVNISARTQHENEFYDNLALIQITTMVLQARSVAERDELISRFVGWAIQHEKINALRRTPTFQINELSREIVSQVEKLRTMQLVEQQQQQAQALALFAAAIQQQQLIQNLLEKNQANRNMSAPCTNLIASPGKCDLFAFDALVLDADLLVEDLNAVREFREYGNIIQICIPYAAINQLDYYKEALKRRDPPTSQRAQAANALLCRYKRDCGDYIHIQENKEYLRAAPRIASRRFANNERVVDYALYLSSKRGLRCAIFSNDRHMQNEAYRCGVPCVNSRQVREMLPEQVECWSAAPNVYVGANETMHEYY